MSCRQAQGWHNFRLDYLAQALGYSFQADFTLTWLDAARRGHGNCESSKPAKLRLINPPETPESVSEFGTETETEPGQAWYLRVPLWGRCLKPDRLRRFACADATHKLLDPLMRQLFSALPRPHPRRPHTHIVQIIQNSFSISSRQAGAACTTGILWCTIRHDLYIYLIQILIKPKGRN